mgnify:FL=1
MKRFLFRAKRFARKCDIRLRRRFRSFATFVTVQRRRVGSHLRVVVWPRLKLRLNQFSVLLITRGIVPIKAHYLIHRLMVVTAFKFVLKITAVIVVLLIARAQGLFGESLSLREYRWWILGVLVALCVVLLSVLLYRKGVRLKKFSLPGSVGERFSFKGFLKLALLVFVIFFFKDVIVATAAGIWSIRPTDENIARWEKDKRAAEEATRKARRTDWPCTYDLSEYGGKHVANHDAKFLKPDDGEAWKVCFYDRRKPEPLSNQQLNNFWKDTFPTLVGDSAGWDVIVIKNRDFNTKTCMVRDKHNNAYYRQQFPKESGEVSIDMVDESRRLVIGGDSKEEAESGKIPQVFTISC